MKYMIDASMITCLIRQKPRKVIERFMNLNGTDICISSITFARLMNEVIKSADPDQNMTALMRLLGNILIISFNEYAAVEYGLIKNELDGNNIHMESMDLLLAAHARAEKLTLITTKIETYSPVNNLVCDNWFVDA